MLVPNINLPQPGMKKEVSIVMWNKIRRTMNNILWRKLTGLVPLGWSCCEQTVTLQPIVEKAITGQRLTFKSILLGCGSFFFFKWTTYQQSILVKKSCYLHWGAKEINRCFFMTGSNINNQSWYWVCGGMHPQEQSQAVYLQVCFSCKAARWRQTQLDNQGSAAAHVDFEEWCWSTRR